ncbi:major facilitator superfamily domain-containing protein [Fennellomyces sp. T-0311]|nr:major facilitator superfamily domain-containing protein [Fennellomyces sp. T-0311]
MSSPEEKEATIDGSIDGSDTKNTPDQKPKKTLLASVVRVILLFNILISTFMVSLNATVIAPAMSSIATSLDAIEEQTWIATAFVVALNTLQPIAGKFSDIFGRKPLLLFGQLFFLLGSLISSVSPTINGLIAGRVVQGLGSGAVLAMVFVIVVDIAPPEWRPRMQAMLMMIYGVASVVGPLIGGAFVDRLTWRWIFRLNMILAGTTFIITFLLFKESSIVRKESMWTKIKRIDFLGTFFVASLVTNILLAIGWGPRYGWKDAHSIGPFVAAAVSLVLLIASEGWISAEPLMPPSVITSVKVFPIYLYMGTLGLSFIGILFFGPILYQAVFAASSTASGIRLIPYMACLILASFISGLSVRVFPYLKFYIVLGSAFNVLGLGLFQLVNEDSNWGIQAGLLTFSGLAVGFSQQNCLLSVQMVVEKQHLAVATVLTNVFMFFASSIGIGVYQALMTTFLVAQLRGVDPQILAIAQQYGALKNHLLVRTMPEEAQGPIIHAYMNALRNMFIIPLVAASIGLIAAVCFRNVRYSAPPVPDQKPTADDKSDEQA